MRAGTRLRALSFLALAATMGLGGCVAVPMGISVVGAGSGISFTSTIAYRSFTYPRAQVRAAALEAMARMQITKTKDEKKGDEIKIKGETKHLTIYITLDSITPAVTKASVNAKKNWFMKDQSVAFEILLQMEQVLGRADSGNVAGPRLEVLPPR
jgi:hypothetical protein